MLSDFTQNSYECCHHDSMIEYKDNSPSMMIVIQIILLAYLMISRIGLDYGLVPFHRAII